MSYVENNNCNKLDKMMLKKREEASLSHLQLTYGYASFPTQTETLEVRVCSTHTRASKVHCVIFGNFEEDKATPSGNISVLLYCDYRLLSMYLWAVCLVFYQYKHHKSC